MDVPCPNCNSTDLKKVSLVYEERLYQSDKRAQSRGVLIGSGGPGVLVGTSPTKGTKQRGLTAQSGGWGHVESARTSARLLSLETFVVQIFVATTASRSCWSYRSKIVWRVELFGPNHEIE
jgi:hypothetical protein